VRVTVDTPLGPLELEDGRLAAHEARLHGGPRPRPVRLAFAAAHVCMRAEYAAVPHRHDEPVPGAEIEPFIDWEATLAVRKRLDRHGFGVAEAMDTAQRFQVGWPVAARLIECTGALRLKHGFCAGASADHLEGEPDEAALVEGVAWQAAFIRRHGGVPVILPMPRLSLEGGDEEGFVRVYGAILERVEGPVLVHWLGPMFLASLEGYFPGDSFRRVMALDPAKVRGAKLSLLDAELERRLRAELAASDQLLLTGDDFHFADLIDGPPPTGATTVGEREVATGEFSHALLGILDAVHEPAGIALQLLARGDREAFRELMEPCEALGRHLFAAPTQHYKAGIAFLSWLAGGQPNPMLPVHEERAREAAHLVEAARLASAAGLFRDAAAAAGRLRGFLDGA
jgi:hypothetical protein